MKARYTEPNLDQDLNNAAKNARTIEEIGVLITHELRQNSVYGLKVFDNREFAGAERFAGGSRTNVYRKRMADDRIVAIKVFRNGIEKNAMATSTLKTKIVKYFVRECGIWHSVSTHTNIVELLGVVERYGDGRLPALVSELYPLGTLRSLVNKEGLNLSVQERTKLLHDACTGLCHLHRSGVVHRDVRGDNIFLKDSDGKRIAALGDFGSAKFEDGEKFRVENSTSITTAEWAPPEYVIAGKLNYSTMTSEGDMWSFGCTVLEVLTGKNPWRGENSLALLHLSGSLPPYHPVKPEDVIIGKAHWDIMTWCWDTISAKRLDADSILLALGDIMNDDGS